MQKRLKRIRIPYSVLLPLFFAGMSTRDIGRQVGLSSSRVSKMLIDLGLAHDRSEIAIRKQPSQSKHWRSARAAARRLWERQVGPIPEGWHIHHKNRDYTDNKIENLECITASEHAKLHHPKNPIPRHLRPERKAYMLEWSSKHPNYQTEYSRKRREAARD